MPTLKVGSSLVNLFRAFENAPEDSLFLGATARLMTGSGTVMLVMAYLWDNSSDVSMQGMPAVSQVGAGFMNTPGKSLLLGTAASFTMCFGTTMQVMAYLEDKAELVNAL